MNSISDIYSGLHVLLVSEDDARAKALTKALRDHHGRVSDLTASLRDPAVPRGVDIILVDTRSEASNESRLSELRADVRARWAALARADYAELVKADGSVMMAALAELIAPSIEEDRKLTERAREESTFTTQLAPLGPSRTLRALSRSGHTLLVELRHPALSASVEVANELLVSASAARAEKRWEAWSALVRILGLKDAEVMVARRSFTSAMNIMEPVDQALEVAAQERHCSAAQIASEEADAERAAAKGRPSLPAPEPRNKLGGPGYAPPRPPAARPAPPNSANRTLLGIVTPALPALASPGKPSELQAAPTAPAAMLPPPTLPPAARQVSRQATSQKLNMTLLGIAPGSVPGLAELRAQLQGAAPASSSPNGRESSAASETVSSPQLQQPTREVPNFDPPTGRSKVDPALLSQLDELDDDLDEMTIVAAPLSAPLPPPRSAMSANDNDVPLEAPLGTEPEPDELEPGDVLAETSPTPTDMRSQLIARSSDELAPTERPPARISDVADEESDDDEEHAGPALPKSDSQVAAAPSLARDTFPPEPSSPDLQAAGEETWVVRRDPPRAKPQSRANHWVVGIALAGLLGAVAAAALYRRPPAKQERAEEPSQPAMQPQGSRAAPDRQASPSAGPAAPERPATESARPEAPQAPASPPVAAPVPAVPAPGPGAATSEQAAAPTQPDPVPPPAPVAESGKPTAAEAAAEVAEAPSAAASATDLPSLLKQAQRLLAERKYAEARPVFEQALTLDGANPHVRAGLAESLLKNGEPQDALIHAQSATKLRPKRARYQVLLGDVLAALSKPDLAQAAWKKAIELDPNEPDAKQRLAK